MEGAGPAPARFVPGNIPQAKEPDNAESGAHPDMVMCRAPRQTNTWTHCPGSAFNVRQGPNYAATGKKVASLPPLYDVVACDSFNTEQKLTHLGRVAALPDEPSCSDVPPLLIINFMLPNYAPSSMMASQKRVDGPGWSLVLYCRLSAAVCEAVEQGRPASPALDLWRRFVHPTEGVSLRQNRVKMIFGICDTEEPAFSMVTKSLVNRYNYKPFLSKTACSFFSVPGKYFEIDLDMHTWSSAALNGLNTIKARMYMALGRVGCVIESEGDEEMPEQMLCGTYLTHLTPQTPPFDAALTHYLVDERNYMPPLAGSLGTA